MLVCVYSSSPPSTSSSGSAPSASGEASTTTSRISFPCQFCNQILSSSSNRSRHVKRKHSVQRITSETNQTSTPLSAASVMHTRADSFSTSTVYVTSSSSSVPSSSSSSLTSSSFPTSCLAGADDDAAVTNDSLWTRQDAPPSPVSDTEENASFGSAEEESDFTELMESASYDSVRHRSELSSQGARQLKRSFDSTHSSGTSDMLPATAPVATTQALDTVTPINMDSSKTFIQWLGEAPITELERMVKATRVTTDSQLKIVRWNLKFLFSVLVTKELCASTYISLSVFTQLTTCKAVHASLKERSSGPCRIHTLFLLIKKILVYLSSEESSRLAQYVPPTTYPSYQYVSSICTESTKQRKLLEQDRIAGVTADQQPGDSSSSSPPASAPLSTMELQSLISACLRYLKAASNGTRISTNYSEATRFAAYLVCAFMILGLAPRSQVLSEAQIGKSFVRERDGTFWFRLSGSQSKNGKPVVLPVPSELTAYFAVYLSVARETLLKTIAAKSMSSVACSTVSSSASVSAASSSPSPEVTLAKHLFINRKGGKRSSFCDWCKYVSLTVIGRGITTHTFRSR